MKFLPFPEPHRSDFAASTKARYEAEVAERRRRGGKGPYTPKVGETKTHIGLCYKMPDGKLRPVYDPYKAQYPEGATPGWGRIKSTCKWYPNDTYGDETHVDRFEPLP